MKLLNKRSNRRFEAEVIGIGAAEVASITRSKRFEFNWSKEGASQIFKIVKAGDELALGLLAIIDYPYESRIHVQLIESANENKGRDKKIDWIAGCLLAYSAQLSFQKGYMGFVSLILKTELIPLYMGKYGFQQVGRQLALETHAAIELIKQYL